MAAKEYTKTHVSITAKYLQLISEFKYFKCSERDLLNANFRSLNITDIATT